MQLRNISFFALGLCIAASTAFSESIRLRADNWMPFNGDPKADKPGYVVELCKAIFEPQGIKIDYDTMPWEEAVKAAREGSIDGVIGAAPDEGKGLVFPKESINVLRIALVGKKGLTWNLENAASFEKVKIGVVPGYAYWEGLDNYIKTAKPTRVVVFTGDNPTETAIRKLQEGVIDLFPENLIVFSWNVRALGLKTTDFKPYYINTGDDIYVAFTPKGPNGARWAKLFDEGIQKLRKSGELKKILSAYGVEDWK